MKAIFVNDTSYKIDEDKISHWVQQVAETLHAETLIIEESLSKELTLVFLNKLEAKKLNWQYRQKDYATDILSFESDSKDSMGDLVMCPEVLETQAKENKKTFMQELNYMILHGVLHLLGYDHEKDEKSAKEMMALQDRIFEKLQAASKSSKKKAPVKAKAVAKKKSKTKKMK